MPAAVTEVEKWWFRRVSLAVLFALLIIVGIPASCSVMTARIESDVQLAKVRAHVDSMGVTNAR